MNHAGWVAEFDDERRLAALESYELLDTKAEERFDGITRLCGDALDVPIALVSLVDRERQWFKSRVGLDAIQTPRDIAFCDHAIRQRETMIVEDACADPRFAGNPLVTSEPNIRFYAGVPLRTPDGHALGTLCAIDRRPRSLSASQQRVLEELAHQVELEFELRRSDRALRAALDSERTKQRHKEMLAAMVVHDLRSPLTGISLTALAGLQQAPEDVKSDLNCIADAARRAQTMLSNLLDMCLSELGGLRPRPVHLSTAGLVDDALQQVAPLARDNHVELTCDAVHVAVNGDPDLLGRALVNVLENAIRASTSGATVHCSTSAGPRGEAIVCVADCGPGIPDDDKERVFAPLQQGPAESQGMHGLGLAFCASAVRAHDGSIRIEDNQPQGTRVVIELPAARGSDRANGGGSHGQNSNDI